MQGNQIQVSTMPQAHRDLLLRVWDGHGPALPWLMHVYNFRRREEILRWLIQHHLIGTQFVAWIQNVMGGSILKSVAFVISRLEREKNMRDLLIGKDYLP